MAASVLNSPRAVACPSARTVLDSPGPPMSDRYTQDDLADPERRAALTEALAGRRVALTVREVSPEHGTGWGMAAEFPDGVWFELSQLDHDHPAHAGARLGEAVVEPREVDGRWRFAVVDLIPAPPAQQEPAEPVADGTEPEVAGPAEAESPAAEESSPAGAAGEKAGQPARPPKPEKAAAPRVVRGDELLRRVLQLLVRRAREGRRAPSPKLKTAVADGRALALDLAVLERWLPSAEHAIQLEGRARRWLDAALDKHATPERADARESLQCLLETFDRAGQPLANLARRAFADRERKPAPSPERAERPRSQRPRRQRPARARREAPADAAVAAQPALASDALAEAPAEAAPEALPPQPAVQSDVVDPAPAGD